MGAEAPKIRTAPEAAERTIERHSPAMRRQSGRRCEWSEAKKTVETRVASVDGEQALRCETGKKTDHENTSREWSDGGCEHMPF